MFCIEFYSFVFFSNSFYKLSQKYQRKGAIQYKANILLGSVYFIVIKSHTNLRISYTTNMVLYGCVSSASEVRDLNTFDTRKQLNINWSHDKCPFTRYLINTGKSKTINTLHFNGEMNRTLPPTKTPSLITWRIFQVR